MNSGLNRFLRVALEFTVTQGTFCYVLLSAHPPSDNGLVEHLLLLFVGESDSRRVGRVN